MEWDYSIQHWKIVANTLGDLTKRENRFCHYGYVPGSGSNPGKRIFPYPLVSFGSGYSGATQNVQFVVDPEIGGTNGAKATANLSNASVVSYTADNPANYTDTSRRYNVRPFAFVSATPKRRPGHGTGRAK